MKATIEGGKIHISINDLIDQLSGEEKLEFATSLVWEEPILREVIRVLSDDLATDSYNYNVFEMRKLLSEKMSDILRSLVQGILDMWLREKKDKQRVDAWAWELYHAWPEEYRNIRPMQKPWEPSGYVNYQQADQIIVAISDILRQGK